VAGSVDLMSGTAVKSATQSPGIEVATTGTLSASGVIFTTVSDSSVDGDSPGDGGLSKPSVGDYGAGGGIRYDDVPSATISGATFSYAGIAVDSPDGGEVTVSGDTFAMNETAVSDTLDAGGSAAVDNSTFDGNQVAIDASPIWEPFSTVGISCQFLGSVSTDQNSYGTGAPSTNPLVTPSDRASIEAAMAVKGTTDDPDGWTKLISASGSDVVEGWEVEPCADPHDSHAVVAIPMTFNSTP
jgi:hypothetical protein